MTQPGIEPRSPGPLTKTLPTRGSIPGRVTPKTFKKWYLIPPYKVRIKGKVEQSKERSIVFPYTSVLKREPIEKGAFWSPSTTVANFLLLLLLPPSSYYYYFSLFFLLLLLLLDLLNIPFFFLRIFLSATDYGCRLKKKKERKKRTTLKHPVSFHY